MFNYYSLNLLVLFLILSNYICFSSKLIKKHHHEENSFLQLKEVDDYEDDDADEENSEVQKLIKAKKAQENKIVFTELNTKNKDENMKKKKKKKPNKYMKKIDELKYLKRKNDASDLVRNKLFRIGTINEIQKSKRWRHSISEDMKGKFSKIMASQGNKNADEFVSFLGFMRDSGYKANANVLEKDMNRFFNN